MTTLNDTSCNFVRCIKASNPLQTGQFTSALVLNQLRYTGMLDTLNIRRLGFPFRMDPNKFWEQYHVLDVNSKYDKETDTYEVDKLVETLKGKAASVAEEVKERTGVELDDDQIAEAICLGKSASLAKGERFIQGTTQVAHDMVLVRDWYARELEDMTNKEKSHAAVVVQSVYRGFHFAEVYAEKKEACDTIIPIIRGTLEMLKYLEKKWVYCQISSRSNLQELIRATQRRSTSSEAVFCYYRERKKLFFDLNRHKLHECIYATVMRQKYYEGKIKYMEKAMIKKETLRMIKSDHSSTKYMIEKSKQEKIEAEEAAQLMAEDEYMKELVFMKKKEVFTQQGERELLYAELCMRQAAHQVEKVRSTEMDMMMRQARYDQHHEQIEAAAKRKTMEVMVRMGLIARDHTSSAKPPLPALPKDNDLEGLYQYFKDHVRSTSAGEMAGSVAEAGEFMGLGDTNVTYDTDLVHKLTSQQQKVFVSKIASLIDCSEDELVVHMTPRTPGRRPDYKSASYQGSDWQEY